MTYASDASISIDRGFYTIEVISYLKRRKIPFVMPVVRRGKKGGTRALLKTKKSYTTEYTMKNAAKHAEVTFFVHVVSQDISQEQVR